MKYYQTVTTATTTCDEWIYYEGYDKEEAFKQCAHEKSHNDKNHSTEVREYELPDDRKFEDLDDDEQCAVLSCYNVLRGKMR